MNRRQKVAVVVGAVVMVLLVLFPPWRLGDGTSEEFGWSYRHGPAWIGSPPESPAQDQVLPAFQEFVSYQVRQVQSGAPQYAAFTMQRPEKTTATVDWGQLIAHLAAALALTAAAVVLLTGRKAGQLSP